MCVRVRVVLVCALFENSSQRPPRTGCCAVRCGAVRCGCRDQIIYGSLRNLTGLRPCASKREGVHPLRVRLRLCLRLAPRPQEASMRVGAGKALSLVIFFQLAPFSEPSLSCL